MKLALTMCVKGTDDEAILLDQCLKSVHKHVDGIFLQLNAPKGKKISPKVRKVAQKYTKNIEDYVWAGNFAKAKQANIKQVPKDYDWIMWLDTDDTVDNPEKIKQVLSIAPKDRHGIYVKYDYTHDQWGNVIVSHWNNRIVRNNGAFSWKSSIDDSEVSVHETLVPNRSVKYGFAEEFKVVHHDTPDRRLSSKLRNLELLEGMYERHREKPDPRILFYLGRDYYNAGELEKSRERMYEYLQLSGWSEERSEAHIFMGKIFLAYLKTHQARTAFLQALGENNNNVSAYFELAKLDYAEQRFTQAVFWLKSALKIKQGPQAMDLFNEQPELYLLLAECLLELGGKDLTEASKWAQKAVEERPFDPEFIERRDKIQNVIEYRDDMRAAARLIRKLERDKETSKIIPLIENLPKEIEDSPVLAGAKLKHKKPITWPRKSIVIYCAASALGIWGPWSLEKGIGGSEEAVIQLSKELNDLGWQVVVYATPGDRAGDYDGVIWKQYWEFNPSDEFDAVVAWRMPSFFDEPIKARKKYLWLHDVMEVHEFTKERLNNLDKVIVLSEYHRSLFPMIKEDKIFLSANGIIAEDFGPPINIGAISDWGCGCKQKDGIKIVFCDKHPSKRDPHRVIYMSSHIRGLALLYDIWPDVRKAVPDAKLDIYYGWDSYINMNHSNPGNQPGGMGWLRMMQSWEQKLRPLGVMDHGKIGHKQIIDEIYKSGVWAYPCPFPEIYCITAIKAQAGGAVPVSSNFAALKETVKYGAILTMTAQDEDTPVGKWNKKDVAEYKEALIDMLKHPEKQEKIRPEMMKWARTQSWRKVAQSWSVEME